jgi:hypothetical protein
MPRSHQFPSPAIPRQLRRGFQLLLKSDQYAHDLECDPWQFAVEYRCLREVGFSVSDLRWLQARGWLQHAIETTAPAGSGERMFEEPTPFMVLSRRSCFLLSDSGIAAATFQHAHGSGRSRSPQRVPAPSGMQDTGRRPQWDRESMELRFADVLVKRFRLPSPNQVAILDAFEEEGWPARIDDPLPPQPGIEPKRRLHDAVKNLNRNQQVACLRFHGDGTGQRVRWAVIPGAAEDPHHNGAGGQGAEDQFSG